LRVVSPPAKPPDPAFRFEIKLNSNIQPTCDRGRFLEAV